jgi:hypothetical protein
MPARLLASRRGWGTWLTRSERLVGFRQVTIGASFLSQTVALTDGTTVKFEIWDTAGQVRALCWLSVWLAVLVSCVAHATAVCSHGARPVAQPDAKGIWDGATQTRRETLRTRSGRPKPSRTSHQFLNTALRRCARGTSSERGSDVHGTLT